MLTSKSHPDRRLVVAIRQIALYLTAILLCCGCDSERGKLFEQLD